MNTTTRIKVGIKAGLVLCSNKTKNHDHTHLAGAYRRNAVHGGVDLVCF
jgi:hypothetical protein